jgi:hypothetical protein
MLVFVSYVLGFDVNSVLLTALLNIQVKVKFSLTLTNSALRHEDVWGSGYIDPRVLHLGTSWR